MLERKAYSKLLDWKNNHKNTSLIVYGARQVGKTYLVRDFGKREYESYVEINFIKDPALKTIFDESLEPNDIFKSMSSKIKDLNLIVGKTLIFFDEIQSCGKARTALKFLAEDGRYDFIASGSLLGLAYGEDGDKNVEEPESIPVGYEDSFTLYPLDFEEFLWSLGYKKAVPILKEYYELKEKIPGDINDKYERLFREFIVVGGMPEVVDSYSKDLNYNLVDSIQNKILSDYRNDISKHAKGAEKVKVRKCYDAIPVQLAKELKKFQYSTVEKGQTSKKYGGSIQWLIDSQLVNPCYNVHEAYVPLLGNSNQDQFKLYINDTGLLCAMYGFETKSAILDNLIKGNAKGGVYENAIAQELVKNGRRLYYYKPNDSQEIEFLIERRGEVIPLEVKAGNTSSVSLNTFIEQYKPSQSYKLINGNIGLNGNKFTIPHYLIMFI